MFHPYFRRYRQGGPKSLKTKLEMSVQHCCVSQALLVGLKCTLFSQLYGTVNSSRTPLFRWILESLFTMVCPQSKTSVLSAVYAFTFPIFNKQWFKGWIIHAHKVHTHKQRKRKSEGREREEERGREREGRREMEMERDLYFDPLHY